MKRGFIVNFVIGLLVVYAFIIIALPTVLIASNTVDLVKNLTTHQDINWGKGDPWTPERSYVCPGGWKHPDMKSHCTFSEYFDATFGLIIPFTFLLLVLFFAAPVLFVMQPDAWFFASLHLVPIFVAIIISVILTKKEKRATAKHEEKLQTITTE